MIKAVGFIDPSGVTNAFTDGQFTIGVSYAVFDGENWGSFSSIVNNPQFEPDDTDEDINNTIIAEIKSSALSQNSIEVDTNEVRLLNPILSVIG